MPMTTKECVSCAARVTDGAAFQLGHNLCSDCLNEAARTRANELPADRMRRLEEIRSRRSYRAALRYRQQSPQLDLVDIITPIPGGAL